ncbi:DUF4097 family beta strand repeat-containing protein [Occultella gossypii]|uniref:DUF4097 family beta strand repeat protein n=1 Tax=Occultella gossypii TaxID=2800820 RepID=A0ABS7S7T6_9MICO|nr:DUF4097 family beta strand repeat-containing protein [Occultella gossypii]MBZ2195805.1 DUF4097 family beta strand repeat protein [Occultella gossypii]
MTDYEFPVTGPVRVHAKMRASDLILAAADPADVPGVARVRLIVRGSDGAAIAEATRVTFEGGDLRIEVPTARTRLFGGSARLRVEVDVPAGSDLDLETGSGDVLASGRLGRTRVKSGSGDVEIRSAEDLDATSGSGDVSIGSVGTGHLVSGSGDVHVGTAGNLEVRTGSGDVGVDSGGDVDAATGSGDIVIKEVTGRVGLRTGSGDLVVRRAADGEITAKAASGDIVVGIPLGTAAMLDCSSISGSVHSELTPGDGPDGEGGGAVVLRLRTVSGDVLVRRA